MKNLLNYKGRRFTATIEGYRVEGKIQVERGSVYLCQNQKNGKDASDKLGYSFSWIVGQGDERRMRHEGVENFKLQEALPISGMDLVNNLLNTKKQN